MDDVHCCQACHTLTDRKCSVCGVCVFCSTDCEKRAERMLAFTEPGEYVVDDDGSGAPAHSCALL